MKNVSVRDFFAGQYLNAYINQNFAAMNLNMDIVSEQEFEWADKMMAARSCNKLDERIMKETATAALQVVSDLHICRQQLQKEMELTNSVEEANKTLRDNLTQLTSYNQDLECECDRLRKMLMDEERITKNLSITNSNISNELQSIKETLRKLSGEE